MYEVPPLSNKDLIGPDDIIRGLPNLPSAPAILPKVMNMLSDDSCPLDDVAELIKTDQGMAAQVLVLSNSAYYGVGGRCTSVDDAIKRVGYLKVYELVAYAASSQMILRANHAYSFEAADMWRLSVTGAIASERLASRISLDSKAAYTMGLLHCSGLIVIDLWAKKTKSPWSFPWSGYPDERSSEEKRVIGFTNASVAAALLKHWKFPSDIVEPIRWQYAPSFAGYHQKSACVLNVARWLRDASKATNDAELPPLPPAWALSQLGLLPEDLSTLRNDVSVAYAKTSSLHEELQAATP